MTFIRMWIWAALLLVSRRSASMQITSTDINLYTCIIIHLHQQEKKMLSHFGSWSHFEADWFLNISETAPVNQTTSALFICYELWTENNTGPREEPVCTISPPQSFLIFCQYQLQQQQQKRYFQGIIFHGSVYEPKVNAEHPYDNWGRDLFIALDRT